MTDAVYVNPGFSEVAYAIMDEVLAPAYKV